MAGRKSTKTEELENATAKKVEGVEVTETIDVKDAVAEPIKKEPKVLVVNPMVNSTVSAYKIPTLNSKYEAFKLTPGTPYIIVDETVSDINGKFYQISTGEYVSALSNITVS